MSELYYYISPQALLDFAKHNHLAWQECDNLIMFTPGDDHSSDEFISNDHDEYEIERNNELFRILSQSTECKLFDRLHDDESGFEDLLDWATDDDLLIVVDNQILLCVASCDRNKIIFLS